MNDNLKYLMFGGGSVLLVYISINLIQKVTEKEQRRNKEKSLKQEAAEHMKRIKKAA